MKELPILFQAEMVRALLEDRKTQTRRLRGLDKINENPDHWLFKGWVGIERLTAVFSNLETDEVLSIKSPYGNPGDVLYVRENFLHEMWGMTMPCGEYESYFSGKGCKIEYCADIPSPEPRTLNPGTYNSNWMVRRPSIHMPRWASRINLKVTGIRIERLKSISDDDADAECFNGDFPPNIMPEVFSPHKDWGHLSIAQCYLYLWDTINGKGSSEANPWVWAVDFERMEK